MFNLRYFTPLIQKSTMQARSFSSMLPSQSYRGVVHRTTSSPFSSLTRRRLPSSALSQSASKSSLVPFLARLASSPSSREKFGALGLGLGTLCVGGVFVYGMTSAAEGPQRFPAHVRQRLSATYGYMTAGLATTALSASLFWRSGLPLRFSPLPFALVSAGACIASLFALQSVPPSQKPLRHLLFLAFTAAQGLALCPLALYSGPLLLQAAAATGALMGSLTLVAAAAPSDAFLQWAGPLSLGVGLVMAASLGSLFFPGSSLLYNVVMYGGLAVFGGMTMLDTQRIVKMAKHQYQYDPLGNSVSIYLNFVHIFIRLASLLSDRKRK